MYTCATALLPYPATCTAVSWLTFLAREQRVSAL